MTTGPIAPVREFSADYLRRTREGMWDSLEALAPLELDDRGRILDVGCGSGELSRVLAANSPATVIGCDADRELLAVAADYVPVFAGDASRLPLADGAVDLVVCQALLINLPEPTAALREFARVSSDLVAAIEPDNGAVDVESTVADEAALERRARRAYLEGVDTDVTLGADAAGAFAAAGVETIASRRYDHVRTVEPPYDGRALANARRKLTGAGLADDRATLLAGELSPTGYDELRSDWREMGRSVAEQMRAGEYHRTETVPFYVTVGRLPKRARGE